MLHACVQKFDMTGKFEKFWELNSPSPCIYHLCFSVAWWPWWLTSWGAFCLSPHVRVLSRAATNQLWVLSSSFFSEPGAMTSSSRGGACMQGASWTLAPTGHGDYHLRIIIHASRPSVMQGILERNETDEDKLVATDCGGHVIGRSTRTRGPWPKPDCTSLVLHCNKMYMLCIFFSFFL
jgi:hypothetical protein